MGSAQEDTSQKPQPDTSCRERPDSVMAVRCSTEDNQRYLPSLNTKKIQPAGQPLLAVQKSRLPMFTSGHSLTNSPQFQESSLSSITTSSSRHLEQSRPRQAALPPVTWKSSGTVTTTNLRDSPSDDGDITDPESIETPGPASKRCKLSDDGWIEEALKRGQEERGAPDPCPIPQLTPPGRSWESHAHPQPKGAANQPRVQPSPRWLSPPGNSRSPTIHSATLSRRPSSVYSTSSSSHSPALTHQSNTLANRHGLSSPHDGSMMGGFSDLEIGSRANSRASDSTDFNATFAQIHDMPQAVLPPRRAADLSKLEQLPKQIFMRIMMYCGYKAQVLLKKCSYSLYLAVNLDVVPWEEKTSTILFEERNNPTNFPKKPTRAQHDESKGADDDEDSRRPKKATKQKKGNGKAESSSPQSSFSKSKAHIDTYGKWGCYCCYQILPAHYFEGALLEDKEGRTPKSNKLRGVDAAESDKKVDMRVEYVQVLGAVPGSRFPDWLSKTMPKIHATNTEAYLREKMERGVNCDDLRAYYKDITRDIHLVAPIRGITPVFTPSPVAIRSPHVGLVSNAPKYLDEASISPHIKHTPLPAMQARGEGMGNDEIDPDKARPLYKLQAGNATHNADRASYTYQIRIPGDAERDLSPLSLPKTEPVGRICLPPMNSPLQGPVLEAGDVVSLRRICIPCGTKFAVYRRNCNRKIISKTDEQWWVCDCPEIRLAGKSTGCPTCGRKVIY